MSNQKIHLVIGAGNVGKSLALLLAEAGEKVVLATKSGSGPSHPNIARFAVDASDPQALIAIAPEAVAIYNCVNPPYTRWLKDWPALAESFLVYAEKTGAVLVTCSNLYGYGRVTGVIKESTPLNATFATGVLRAQMWQEAKRRHDAGRIVMTEVRSADFICAGPQSRVGIRVMSKILNGKKGQVLGPIDQPHSWTFPLDIARLMQAVAQDPQAWGKAWHVPSNPPKTQFEVVSEMAALGGISKITLTQIPDRLWNFLALFNPMLKSLKETAYQMETPFIIDDRAAREAFGIEPTPWVEVLTQNLNDNREKIAKA